MDDNVHDGGMVCVICERRSTMLKKRMMIALSSQSSYLWSGLRVFMACVVLGGETGASG